MTIAAIATDIVKRVAINGYRRSGQIIIIAASLKLVGVFSPLGSTLSFCRAEPTGRVRDLFDIQGPQDLQGKKLF
jgi:hypothetical protein